MDREEFMNILHDLREAFRVYILEYKPSGKNKHRLCVFPQGSQTAVEIKTGNIHRSINPALADIEGWNAEVVWDKAQKMEPEKFLIAVLRALRLLIN